MTLDLKSLTYVSVAREGLSARDLAEIHCTAMQLNALDGVTGLLIFNGSHFMQVIEGAESAIDDLLARLRADPRHHDLDVRDCRVIATRSFPDWSMDLLCIGHEPGEAGKALARKLPPELPQPVLDAIRLVADGLPSDVSPAR